MVVGNPVNSSNSRHELHALTRTRSFWRAIVNDAITLAGEEPSQIVAPVGDRATIVSQAVESSPANGFRLTSQGCTLPNQSRGQRRHEQFERRPLSEQRLCRTCEQRRASRAKATASSPKRTRRAR